MQIFFSGTLAMIITWISNTPGWTSCFEWKYDNYGVYYTLKVKQVNNT